METNYPKIIQGGMGIYISSPHLARTVSMLGQQGTVSGVTLERILVRMLQNGDLDGRMRRALAHFPFPHISEEVVNAFFVEGGIPKGKTIKGIPFFSLYPSEILIKTVICANFVFAWLAKEGHSNPVSINYLEKVSMPHIYAITGAMLAGIDIITIGAGIPIKIPAVINAILKWEIVSYPIPVLGKDGKTFLHPMIFEPETFLGKKPFEITKPKFLPIISSNLLATLFLAKLPAGSVYGFVVEEPIAGGHNAPPRKTTYDDWGNLLPIYGDKDKVDYAKLSETGIPFWIGGGFASPERLKWALSVGAKGIQVGSLFALSDESGMYAEIRKRMRVRAFNESLVVKTDMRASPTGYPFKVAQIDDTVSNQAVYEARKRVCSQGGLIELYEKEAFLDKKIILEKEDDCEKEEGISVGYRCAAEPVDKFVAKDGDIADTAGRKCLCNGLLAATGLNDDKEPAIVTIGDDLSFLKHLMNNENASYSAEDAIRYLLGK